MIDALQGQFGLLQHPRTSCPTVPSLTDKPHIQKTSMQRHKKSPRDQRFIAFVAPIQKTGRIAIAFLPPYAPELNPVEAIWAYLKKHEIANLCPTHLAEVSDFARRRLKSMQRRPKLIRALWQQAELAL